MTENLLLGLSVALSPNSILACLFGVSYGMLIGILPGIGSLAAVSLVLPITYALEPSSALIMLAGIFYGSQYGGSITAILLNLPGSATSAVVCIDGYPMSQQGRAGVAILITTVASFIGASIAILILMTIAPTVAKFALRFSAAEFVAIMVLGLFGAASMSQSGILKGLIMVCLGVLFGTIGIDAMSGIQRFTFGIDRLYDGVNLIAVAMGLFGIAEIMKNSRSDARVVVNVPKISIRSLIPTKQDIRRSLFPALRGTAIGSVIGALPGAGPTMAAFFAYSTERKISRFRDELGHGAVEGVAAPEAANNASVQAAFIPTLTLGIPGDATMAILLAAMMIHGIIPRPEFFLNEPEIFWGLIMSFWVGNIMLLILNIPLIGIWVQVLRISRKILYPLVVFFICVGAYTINFSVFDVFVVVFFGVFGYIAIQNKYPPAPFLMGFILGPLLEENFLRAILLARGDYLTFFSRPISGSIFLILSLIILISVATNIAKRHRA